MKKLIIILAILLIAFPVFAAQDAIVKKVTGRVEIQKPGERWQTVSAGDKLPSGASISTGFGSSAVLEVGESELSVDALTRMKLEELIQSEGKQTTGLLLRVGKVKADVKRSANLTHDFRLRSPSSTAAVRGTKFEYSGYTLIVEEGLVYFENPDGFGISIGESEMSTIKNGLMSIPYDELMKMISTDGDAGKGMEVFNPSNRAKLTGTISVIVTE